MANSHVCVGFHCVINVIPAKVPYEFILFSEQIHTFCEKRYTVIHCYMLIHTFVWKRYEFILSSDTIHTSSWYNCPVIHRGFILFMCEFILFHTGVHTFDV